MTEAGDFEGTKLPLSTDQGDRNTVPIYRGDRISNLQFVLG